MLHIINIYLLPILLIVAAVGDVTSLRIPNWLTASTALLFFPMALFSGMPLVEFGMHLLAGVTLFFAGYVLFQFGLFGGGDAKLMAAVGLWIGTDHTLQFLVATAIAGGLLAIVVGVWSVIQMSWDIHGPEKGIGSMGKNLRTLKPNVPYGIALAIGGILVFRETWWMTGIV